MKERDNSKDFKIFDTLNSLNLTLEKNDLEKNVNKLLICLKLFSPRDPQRTLLKKKIMTLKSIYSAIGFYNEEILRKDLEKVKEDIQQIFTSFKTYSGITNSSNTNILQNIKKVKNKKKTLFSLADLANLTESKEEDEEELQQTASLLERQLEEAKELFKENPEIYFYKTPLIISAFTKNSQRYERLGIKFKSSPFGKIWLDQCVVVTKRGSYIEAQDFRQEASKTFGIPLSSVGKVMRHPCFPNYDFLWFLSVEVIKELEISILSNALPFINQKQPGKTSIEELKKLRLERNANKRKGIIVE